MGWNFKKKIRDFKRVKSNLPIVIGNIAKNHYVKSFRDQGFTDKTLNKWQKRSSRNRSDRRNKASRAILVDSGRLRRSIKVGRATFSYIEIGAYGVSYARYHNKGTKKIPKRQFIGESKVVRDSIRKRIRRDIKNVLK